jgi:antitoxin component of RelBE/YafQ-DinJ toxin-antitoxin module
MTITEDDNATMQRIIQVRFPTKLASALERAADRQFVTISDVVRMSIAKAMRDGGLLDA